MRTHVRGVRVVPARANTCARRRTRARAAHRPARSVTVTHKRTHALVVLTLTHWCVSVPVRAPGPCPNYEKGGASRRFPACPRGA
eukprot:13652339-Alexandrium_andersonii.AAC.1